MLRQSSQFIDSLEDQTGSKRDALRQLAAFDCYAERVFLALMGVAVDSSAWYEDKLTRLDSAEQGVIITELYGHFLSQRCKYTTSDHESLSHLLLLGIAEGEYAKAMDESTEQRRRATRLLHKARDEAVEHINRCDLLSEATGALKAMEMARINAASDAQINESIGDDAVGTGATHEADLGENPDPCQMNAAKAAGLAAAAAAVAAGRSVQAVGLAAGEAALKHQATKDQAAAVAGEAVGAAVLTRGGTVSDAVKAAGDAAAAQATRQWLKKLDALKPWADHTDAMGGKISLVESLYAATAELSRVSNIHCLDAHRRNQIRPCKSGTPTRAVALNAEQLYVYLQRRSIERCAFQTLPLVC